MKKLLVSAIILLAFVACKKTTPTTATPPATTTGNSKFIQFHAVTFFALAVGVDSNKATSYYSINGTKTYLPSVPFVNISPLPITKQINNVNIGDVIVLYIEMMQPCHGLGLGVSQFSTNSPYVASSKIDSVFFPLSSPDTTIGTTASLTYTVK